MSLGRLILPLSRPIFRRAELATPQVHAAANWIRQVFAQFVPSKLMRVSCLAQVARIGLYTAQLHGDYCADTER